MIISPNYWISHHLFFSLNLRGNQCTSHPDYKATLARVAPVLTVCDGQGGRTVNERAESKASKARGSDESRLSTGALAFSIASVAKKKAITSAAKFQPQGANATKVTVVRIGKVTQPAHSTATQSVKTAESPRSLPSVPTTTREVAAVPMKKKGNKNINSDDVDLVKPRAKKSKVCDGDASAIFSLPVANSTTGVPSASVSVASKTVQRLSNKVAVGDLQQGAVMSGDHAETRNHCGQGRPEHAVKKKLERKQHDKMKKEPAVEFNVDNLSVCKEGALFTVVQVARPKMRPVTVGSPWSGHENIGVGGDSAWD